MPRNICLAFGRFGSLFLLTSSVSADRVVCLFIIVRLLVIQQPGNTPGIYLNGRWLPSVICYPAKPACEAGSPVPNRARASGDCPANRRLDPRQQSRRVAASILFLRRPMPDQHFARRAEPRQKISHVRRQLPSALL